ncbi:hypothetical protein [Nocardia brasiliensis]|uniref:hypothetical protein n=1 Tax=Nocardia brasiliensis TaxID=37326 RepID=UPI0033FA46DA
MEFAQLLPVVFDVGAASFGFDNKQVRAIPAADMNDQVRPAITFGSIDTERFSLVTMSVVLDVHTDGAIRTLDPIDQSLADSEYECLFVRLGGEQLSLFAV